MVDIPSVTPPQIVNTDEEDDDDMANLFSFDGSEEVTGAETDATNAPATDSEQPLEQDNGDIAVRSTRAVSSDSFLDMLDASADLPSDHGSQQYFDVGGTALHDADTQDILNWLDNDETIVFDDTAETTTPAFVEAEPPSVTPAVSEPEPTVVALPPTFSSLSEALASSEATVSQICSLYRQQGMVAPEQRAELWCRVLTHSSVSDTQQSSMAASFGEWTIPEEESAEDSEVVGDVAWIRQQATTLAQRSNAIDKDDLIKLLLYAYYQRQSSQSQSEQQSQSQQQSQQSEQQSSHGRDVLVPAVASTLLAAGLEDGVGYVTMTRLIPQCMPLLALSPDERHEAAVSMHTYLYHLAWYHVPLLVQHLDRYGLVGWYWPRQQHVTSMKDTATALARNLERHGQVPPSWLSSHLAGEATSTRLLPMPVVLLLWDGLLTLSGNKKNQDVSTAMLFFLTLAVLEQAADNLILLTGDALQQGLEDVFALKEDDNKDETTLVQEWWSRALELQASTPESVVSKLQHAQDEAVQHAVQRRQERAQAELEARLEREAQAHAQAQEQKAQAARERLTRARLVAFYRKHAPDKEGNIDKIMTTYVGRFEVLDAKLYSKYGEGFNPAIKPKPLTKTTGKLLSTMNQGTAESEADSAATTDESSQTRNRICLTVTSEEVLPVLCWSKEAAAARGQERRNHRWTGGGRVPLKFYLVDSRSEDAAREQGRFPTAVSLSPETLLDPERIQQNEEMFESLRGAVHIVVMGEGFSALPELYNEKLSPKLEALMEEDESKTNICALFFIKKGFPFVSVLEGGFAAAHSWLVREGPSRHLQASSVLIDYDPEASMFGQMETMFHASATEKAQRKMQSLLESSLVSMTRRAQQLEKLTMDVDMAEGRQGIRLKLFGRAKSDIKDEDALKGGETSRRESVKEKTEPRFKNPFAAKSKPAAVEVERAQLDSADNERVYKESPEARAANKEAEATKSPSSTGSDDPSPSADTATGSSGETTASPTSAPVPVSASPAPAAASVPATSDAAAAPVSATCATTAAPTQSAPSPFAMFRQAAAKPKEVATTANTTGSTETKPVSNLFKGFGAAFNNSVKATSSTTTSEKPMVAPNVSKRNPFARFGSGGGNKTVQLEAPSHRHASAASFAGLNQLRKSTMARMRNAGSFDDDDATAKDESISFDDATPSTTASRVSSSPSAGAQQKPTEGRSTTT